MIVLMRTVKVHQAKTNFSRLLGLVEAGEEVLVQRGDVPVAKIVPYHSASHARRAGRWRGQIWIAGDFDEIPEGFEDYTG